MSEREPSIDTLIAAARTDIESFLQQNNDIDNAERIVRSLISIIEASDLDQEQKTKTATDLEANFRALQSGYETATTSHQKGEITRLFRVAFRRYTELLDRIESKK
jgi:hypothetical protein